MNEQRNPDRNPNLTEDDSSRSRTPVLDATEKRIDSERSGLGNGQTATPVSLPPKQSDREGLVPDPRKTEVGGDKGGLQTGPETTAPSTGKTMSTGTSSTMDAGTDGGGPGEASTLLSTEKAGGFSSRWMNIQSMFVDEPQTAVRNADGLVSEVIQELSQRFAQERQGLEHQWSGGGDVSTEELRMALRHYRDFFQRLLAA